MIEEANVTLPAMLQGMDEALEDEIKTVQRDRSGSHIATQGQLISQEGNQHLYVFTLQDPWEPQDDTPLKIMFASSADIRGTVVTSTGTQVTIATNDELPPEALTRIAIMDDPSQLLERLREALTSCSEGTAFLGSKSFGLSAFHAGLRPSPVSFGKHFHPDTSQQQAIQMALGSEVTYIVGPPGTGKTMVLAAIAFTHLQAGRSVLIAAHTNIAVDNAVMRLADICRNTEATEALSQHLIIRYGAPQLEQRLRSEYPEVHLPTVVNQQIGNLEQQRKALQQRLHQVTTQLGSAEQEKARQRDQWNKQRQQLINCSEQSQSQLQALCAQERQRLAVLEEQFHTVGREFQQVQQNIEMLKQKQANLAALQVQQHTQRNLCLTYLNDIAARLATAQQTHAAIRLFKGMDLKTLQRQLGELHQRRYQCDQDLARLEQDLQAISGQRADAERHLAILGTTYGGLDTQRGTPSAIAAQTEQLRQTIASCKEELARGDARQNQATQQGELQPLRQACERLREQSAAIEKQLEDIEKRIVGAAKVVATTLCKTYMNARLRERRFDVVILDEVSMASLPTVYIAAAHADSSIVIIGDPRQLAPIVRNQRSFRVQQWLGTDLFTFRNITLEEAASTHAENSILLEQQARMHPQIAAIARKHVYHNLLKNRIMERRQDYTGVAPLPGKALLLCDTSDASPCAIRLKEGSRYNTYHALCTMQLAKQVLASLPPPIHPLQPGEFRVGLVTPYRKQAELLQQRILDEGLQNLVRAGTVHRFQGLEAEVIIFDTVESPPADASLLTIGAWGSQAMRLINVAVTRPQHKLIIVANSQHIQAHFDENDLIRLAVREAQAAGAIHSREELRVPLPHKGISGVSESYEPELLDDRTFYERLLQDLQSAKKQVVIWSPFLSLNRLKQLAPVFQERGQAGVSITTIISSEKTRDPQNRPLIKLLKDTGVRLRDASDMHEKFVFIDEDIVYAGSLNVLSHASTTEYMQRVKSGKFAQRLRSFTNTDARTEIPINGPDIEILRQELPPTTECEKCRNTLRFIEGNKTKGYGPFYGHGKSSRDSCNNTVAISEVFNGVQRLASIRCQECNKLMKIKTIRKDAWLVCAAAPPCDYGQRIVYKN